MSNFDPGPGWRRVRAEEYPETGLVRWTPDDPNEPEVYWVREVPVPPLPIAENTVIHVTWGDDGPTWPSDFILTRWGWFPVDSFNPEACGYFGPAYELDPITSFEVLAEPRDVGYGRGWRDATESAFPVAARDVLARLKETWTRDVGYRFDEIAREFGVES